MIYDQRKFVLSIMLSASISFSAPLSVSAAGIEALSDSLDSGSGSNSTAIATNVKAQETGPVIGVVTALYKLNVRNTPDGKVIDGFLPGVKVDILAREGDWYQIRYNTGTAYVHSSLITIESGTPKVVTPKIDLPATGTTTAIYSLNVRRSAWGEIIDGYKLGTQVEIIGVDGDWYIIRYGEGKAYVHSTLVSVNGKNTPAAQSGQASASGTAAAPSASASASQTVAKGGINGPGIPAELREGIEAAMRTQWYTTPNKCLQYAGTVAHEAGAPDSGKEYTQPQAIWPADTMLRGYYINELPKAVEAGQLLPGMLIHVKVHYDYDPAYSPENDAHHWFVYVGKDEQGVPRFADCLKGATLQTADQMYNCMNGGSAKKYGDAKYGYNRRVTAVYDPFASVR